MSTAPRQLGLPDSGRSLYTLPAQRTWWKNDWRDSKTEAEWLCWLDFLNIRYTPHPQGLLSLHGKPYTPDAALNDFAVFLEVKPYYDVAFLERTRPLGLLGICILTVFGSPYDPTGCASVQVRGWSHHGGRLWQCASMKTVTRQPVYCGGLVLEAQHGIQSYIMPVGKHDHGLRDFLDSDDAQDRDISAANAAVRAERFPVPDNGRSC